MSFGTIELSMRDDLYQGLVLPILISRREITFVDVFQGNPGAELFPYRPQDTEERCCTPGEYQAILAEARAQH